MLIEMLARTTSFDLDRLSRISMTASRRYKIYTIPKRTGGVRTIEHPSRELKAIQRWIIKALFAKFPVHESATAYRKGFGIRENALRHKQTSYTNRYDFADFFPSFQQSSVEKFLALQAKILQIDLSPLDIRFVGNVVCRNQRLTIGAPSSPAITNAMMFKFDENLNNSCESDKLIYTRYADDIFVSSNEPNKLFDVEVRIENAHRGIDYLSLELKNEKTAILSRKYARKVAGVVITPTHNLSIGRERKREIKALVHSWSVGALEKDRFAYLRGLLAFARDIEPDFERRLRAKYGDPTIDRLLFAPDLYA
ncbi:MAG: retron St85 family RNA-directed DNA polymerase [Rhodobacteraceae bacterium]|nr:retron St85 family RNA-directed DNA polymerase [Paracoccaceae bacterium]